MKHSSTVFLTVTSSVHLFIKHSLCVFLQVYMVSTCSCLFDRIPLCVFKATLTVVLATGPTWQHDSAIRNMPRWMCPEHLDPVHSRSTSEREDSLGGVQDPTLDLIIRITLTAVIQTYRDRMVCNNRPRTPYYRIVPHKIPQGTISLFQIQ